MYDVISVDCVSVVFFSSRRRHTRCALVTGVQTCALPIFPVRPRHVFGERGVVPGVGGAAVAGHAAVAMEDFHHALGDSRLDFALHPLLEIGRASCRERVCQYVWISVVAVTLTKNQKPNSTHPTTHTHHNTCTTQNT